MTSQNREIRILARRVSELEKSRAARGPQLGYSSLEDGSLDVFIEDSQTMTIGLQYDGTSTSTVVTGPPPPVPTEPIVSGVLGGLKIRWDGGFLGALVAPMDFARVTVHAQPVEGFTGPDPLNRDTLVGTFSSALAGEVMVSRPDLRECVVYLVAWSQAGRFSQPSDVAYGTPTEVEIPDLTEALAPISDAVAEANTAAAEALENVGLVDAALGSLAEDTRDIGRLTVGELVGDQIATEALLTRHLAANAITAAKIAADAILARNIKAGEIITDHLTANAITAAKIAADAILARNIKAGEIQATHLNVANLIATKALAGTLDATVVTGSTVQTAADGARIVLTTAGLQAYDGVVGAQPVTSISATTGRLTSKDADIQGSITAGATNGDRVIVETGTNPESPGQTWGIVSFVPPTGSKWERSHVWNVTDADYADLVIRGPKTAQQTALPQIRLRSETSPASLTRILMSADQIDATADRVIWGRDGASNVVHQLAYTGVAGATQAYSFRGVGGTKMIGLRFDQTGRNEIYSWDNNAFNRLDLRTSNLQVILTSTTQNLTMGPTSGQGNRPHIGSVESNTVITFGANRAHIQTWDGAVYQPISASAFTVASDMREKTEEVQVVGAMTDLRKLKVYDYLTPHGQPCRDSDGVCEVGQTPTYRQRGLMAQDVLEVLPDAVGIDDADGGDFQTIDLYYILSTAVAGLLETDARLTREVRKLKQQIVDLTPTTEEPTP